MKKPAKNRVYIRAKPKKISIKEIYHYTATIGNNSTLDFDKDETKGEITIEFVYDGHRHGFLGTQARKDLKRQNPDNSVRLAQVGHLAVLKAGRSVWPSWGGEGKTIPITIDVARLQEKLESSQKLTKKYSYCLKEPEAPLLRVLDAQLTDHEPVRGNLKGDLPTSFYPYLLFSIKLAATLPDELLDAIDLPQDRLHALLDVSQAVDVEFLPGNATASAIHQRLTTLARTNQGGYVFIGVANDGKVTGLSKSEAGNLTDCVAEAALLSPDPPIPIPKPTIRHVTVDDEERKLGIVVVPAELKDYLNQTNHEGSFYIDKDLSIDVDLVKELVERGETQDTIFVQPDISVEDLAQTVAALANTRGGYLLFGVEFDPRMKENIITGISGEEATIIWKEKLFPAFNMIRPQLWPRCKQNYVTFKGPREDKVVSVLALYVPGHLPYLYSGDGKSWHRKQDEARDQDRTVFKNAELTPDEIFDLFAKKYETVIQEAAAVREPPEVKFGYIKWPYTTFSTSANTHLPGVSEAREEVEKGDHAHNKEIVYLPSKYDPARGALEWYRAKFAKAKDMASYIVDLRWEIKNPEHLRQDNGTGPLPIRDLKGQFHISLGPLLTSGLKCAYYNALGEPLPDQKEQEIISRQTVIVLDVKLRINELFNKRELLPYRHLEFDGVRPEWERYNDLQEVLCDLGFRLVSNGDYTNLHPAALPNDLILLAEKRSNQGKSTVVVRMFNRWYTVVREVSYGQRVDTVQVPSGRVALDIYGWIEGSNSAELVTSLNSFQRELKERFKYIKVS